MSRLLLTCQSKLRKLRVTSESLWTFTFVSFTDFTSSGIGPCKSRYEEGFVRDGRIQPAGEAGEWSVFMRGNNQRPTVEYHTIREQSHENVLSVSVGKRNTEEAGQHSLPEKDALDSEFHDEKQSDLRSNPSHL